jgi:hypothetical protein
MLVLGLKVNAKYLCALACTLFIEIEYFGKAELPVLSLSLSLSLSLLFYNKALKPWTISVPQERAC